MSAGHSREIGVLGFTGVAVCAESAWGGHGLADACGSGCMRIG